MLQDLRQLARAIRRAKTATTVLLLSLALGTGANAAVYGAINALLLRGPAGIDEPSRLLDIYTSEFGGRAEGSSSFPDYLSVKSESRSLGSIAAIDDNLVRNVNIGEWTRSARIAAVSEDFFTTLQMRAHSGRIPTQADALHDPPGALVSFALSEQLGGSTATLGKTLTIGGIQYVIVGIAPPRFRGLRVGRECDVWIPIAISDNVRGHRRLSIVARLAPGRRAKDAQEDLRRISDDLAARFPQTNRGSVSDPMAPRRITAIRYSQLDPAASAQLFLLAIIVSGAAVLVLASASLNVASLQLSQRMGRRRELALKVALGAPRRRVLRQLLTESLCLSSMGAGLGLLFAIWTTRALPALFMQEQAELLDTRLDERVMFVTVAVTCLAGALVGVAPALRTTASPAAMVLRGDPGGISERPHGRWLRALLVGTQVMLSTILLLGSGLLVNSLTRALGGDVDASVQNVAFVSMELPGRYAQPSRGILQRNSLIDLARSIEGFQAVGWASNLPLERGNKRQFWIEANTPDVTDSVELDTNIVSSGYFGAMGLACIDGRLFDVDDDIRSSPMVIIDETLARRYFNETAIGHHLVDDQGVREKVIGVVRNRRYRTLQGPSQPTVYYPLAHDYLPRGYLVVRTVGPPERMLPTMVSVAREAAAGADVLKTSTLMAHLSERLTLDRLTTVLVGVSSLIALALATIGVCGVISDAVQRRTREIGLRVALGASRTRVGSMVVREAMNLAAFGVGAGVSVAVVIGYIARSRITDLPSFDPVALVSAAAAVIFAMSIGVVPPLRHALSIQPTVALREE